MKFVKEKGTKGILGSFLNFIHQFFEAEEWERKINEWGDEALRKIKELERKGMWNEYYAPIKVSVFETENGFDVYAEGKTFPIKDILKRLGFKWNSYMAKRWELNNVPLEKVREVYNTLKNNPDVAFSFVIDNVKEYIWERFVWRVRKRAKATE